MLNDIIHVITTDIVVIILLTIMFTIAGILGLMRLVLGWLGRVADDEDCEHIGESHICDACSKKYRIE